MMHALHPVRAGRLVMEAILPRDETKGTGFSPQGRDAIEDGGLFEAGAEVWAQMVTTATRRRQDRFAGA
jgi:hypothetical protein